jgi:FixJ family two-component response regulator
MSGPALARQARASYPSLPIIFISGYANPDGHDSELPGRLVRKPFRISDLRDQIEAAIKEARAAMV